MPRNEEGQFEVLLGNKQLLSILFIVVILLGVFFTMGYILGRNSTTAVETPAAGKVAPPPSALAPEPKSASPFGESSQRKPASSPQAASAPEAAQPPAAPMTTQPANMTPPAAAPEPPAAASLEPLVPGAYLQVVATKRPEAELIAEVLKKKGFPSLIAPHPTEPVFRVLVGPLEGPDAIAKARADLQTAGFKPLLRKF